MKKYTAIVCGAASLLFVVFCVASLAVGDGGEHPGIAAPSKTSTDAGGSTMIEIETDAGPGTAMPLTAGTGSQTVYFCVEDEDETITVLKVVNTTNDLVYVSGSAFYSDGMVHSNTWFSLPPNKMVTIGTDNLIAYNPVVWDMYKAAYARLVLPAGVFVDGWTAWWDGPGTYDFDIAGLTRPIRFTTSMP